MLLMAAFGLNPRHGTAIFEAPTFAAPDLELRLLDGNWEWIAWVEGALAIALLLGIYVRGAAAVFLVLGLLGLYLFPYGLLAYFGIVAGAAIYLLLQGPGSLHVPMPTIPGTHKLVAWLADQPRERAQWLLRMSAHHASPPEPEIRKNALDAFRFGFPLLVTPCAVPAVAPDTVAAGDQ